MTYRFASFFSACLLLIHASVRCGAEDSAAIHYVSTSFHNADQNQLRYIYSGDGLHWTNLPGAYLKANVGGKVLRDPSVAQGKDGVFHLVWTSAWHGDQGFGCASSTNLIQWSEQKWIPAMTNEPTTVNVWAPEVFFDESLNRFIIVWASTIPGRFPDLLEKHENNHRLYFTITTNFVDFSPTQLFLDPGFSVIDAFLLKAKTSYVLLCKDNSRPVLSLRVAFGDSATGPWRGMSEPFAPKFNEGPCAIQIGDEWFVFCDSYRKKSYGAFKTRDFKTFTDASAEVSFPEEHKHGTVFTVSDAVMRGLLNAGAESLAKTSAPAAAPKH